MASVFSRVHQLGQQLVVLRQPGNTSWRINCLDIETPQEIVESGMFKHLIDIYLLESNSRLKFHVYVISHAIETIAIFIIIYAPKDLSLVHSLSVSLFLHLIEIGGLFLPRSLFDGSFTLLFRTCLFLLHRRDLHFCVFLEVFSYIHKHQATLRDILLIVNVNFHIELQD